MSKKRETDHAGGVLRRRMAKPVGLAVGALLGVLLAAPSAFAQLGTEG